ncbi:MAG: hypothetical protein IJJ33_00030 [Victivallales bacterium]|nr:hypothetical protein [Victivallales bacterium]
MIFIAEKETFGKLYAFTSTNPDAILTITMNNGVVFNAVADTDYETDNGLEMSDPGYEEFHAMLLRRIDTGELLEITYHNFPRRITCDGVFVAGSEEME